MSQGQEMADGTIHQILDADDLGVAVTRAQDDARPRAGWRIPWERAVRCLFLAGVLAVAGYMAWRPAMLRFSQLMFMVSPSHGDSLAWKPETEIQPLRPAPRRAMPETPEWRPEAGLPAGGQTVRTGSGLDGRPLWRGESQIPAPWRRLSGNPWNWRDDAVPPKPPRARDALPTQKPVTDFRAAIADAWEAPVPAGADAEKNDTARTTEELPPLRLPEPLSPLPVPSTQPVSPIDAPESADWKNQEIAGPVAGAYLTIYPKLKFIGLCVPGQGYIRKYNQVAAPGDTADEKIAAADGRTPYGKYYIAARSRDGGEARLVLSWPSPEDARRLGLDAGQTELIEEAWREQSLPPQDTPAGGGVALTGLRDRMEETDGGFALEAPHMEEIYTALPDGAWVFIQE